MDTSGGKIEVNEDIEIKSEANGNGEQKLFSSADFKIEIQNLPKFFGMGQMKKLFTNKLKLNPHKLKPCGPKANYMYICFKNEEDKQKALMVLDGFNFKGKTLRAKAIKGVSDPYRKKNEFKSKNEEVDTRPVAEKLQDAVCPFARESYEEQLAKKENEVNVLMKRLGSEISRNHDVLRQWVRGNVNEYGTVAPVNNIVKSPQISGYRNKCEFSIGYMTRQTEKKTSQDMDEEVSPEEANGEKV